LKLPLAQTISIWITKAGFVVKLIFFPRLQFQVSLSPPGGLLSKGKIMEELIDMVMTYIPEESKVIVVLFIFVDFMKCFVNYGVF
jgi:hypothetical protein